jgi:CRISPR-associated endonuclease/helicase Cas3
MAGGGLDHHTVLGHSLDVAACAFVLVEHNLVLRAQLSRGSGIGETSVALTFASVCAIHDVGKLDTRFQRKAAIVADLIRPESARTPRIRYDHGTEGFRQIEADEVMARTVAKRLGPVAIPLLRAVCGHHGTLPSADDPDPSRSSLDRSLRREDEAARQAFVDLILDFFTAQGAVLPWPDSINGALVQRLGGLCAVADWVGSNVEHFPYRPVPHDLDAYWTDACSHAVSACESAGLLRAPSASCGFSDLFPGYTPHNVQILTESLPLDVPALVIVEAEMGQGKTEAALAMAARYLGKRIVDGITVALPTMATSNAMFTRVEDWVGRLFPNTEVQLALAHGRARRQPRFQRLVQGGLHARDADAPEASVMCARWLLNRKRILLAQIGVGTIDQALQAALVVRHQFVRMFGLSRNVVVIDEVHAYDAYMEVLLEHLLAWLGALGVPVILLSATLPSERRAALARAWAGSGSSTSTAADDLGSARARPYPLVSVTTQAAGSEAVTNTLALSPPVGEAESSRRLFVEREIRDQEDNTYVDRIARRLISAAVAGARVVWIRNTVREAQRAYRAVAASAGSVEHLLFHARFRGSDRSAVEQAVLQRFGKAAQSGGRVLIATQVVEQSLDLDFDELHTDLAPIDLLLQRAGRLHRHRRARPPGFERRRIVVHVPSDKDAEALRFGPSLYVYDAGTLWIANRALRTRATLDLPDDIRSLIEETYHPASRSALLPLGGAKLVAAEQKRQDNLEAKRTKARHVCIPPTTADPDGGSALDDDDDAVQAFTRDGTSATVLPFWWDGEGGRALDARQEDAAWPIDAQASDAWRLASDLIDHTLSIPARSDVEGAPLDASTTWDRWKARFGRFAEDSGLGHRVVPLPLRRDGDTHKGWLYMDGRRRRVQYTKTLGLLMPSEKDEEQQR